MREVEVLVRMRWYRTRMSCYEAGCMCEERKKESREEVSKWKMMNMLHIIILVMLIMKCGLEKL